MASMGPIMAQMPATPEVRTQFAFTAQVELAPTITIGETPNGVRRYVPITGGKVTGPALAGEILDAGGDFQLLAANGVLEVEARYLIRSNDGTIIGVTNR